MQQRFRYFLVVLLLMFAGKILGQIEPPKIHADKNISYPSRTFNIKTPIFIKTYSPVIKYDTIFLKNYYISCLGFLCRTEYQLQKITAIPFRFRLGSLDYTNYLEQKPNALKPSAY
jgi:hypothetical protein